MAQFSPARAQVVNFFGLLYGEGDFQPRLPSSFDGETGLFLSQLFQQTKIWANGSFHWLDFSQAEIELLTRISVKATPTLYFMGLADAIPHAAQVSRLCASTAHTLNGRHSEVLQSAIVGYLHDPKFEPPLDVTRQNLATHPIVAVALAHAIFEDQEIRSLVSAYFHGNKTLTSDFIEGLLDVLGMNNESWFVQIMFVLPDLVRRIERKYGPEVASGFKAVLEDRVESASKGIAPAELPAYLHGCLQQEFIDSGLRGVSKHGWQQALAEADILVGYPVALFNELLIGNIARVTQEQIAMLRSALHHNTVAILSAQINMTRLLHHHQEVMASGQIAGMALYISDPMMLSPHKVAAVYSNALFERLKSFCQSFDQSIRLLPQCAKNMGIVWQRAVYLSMLLAADRLSGNTNKVSEFEAGHQTSDIKQDVDDLRAIVRNSATWGSWADVAGKAASVATVKQALETLEAAYICVVDQFRVAIQSGARLDKFVPKSA